MTMWWTSVAGVVLVALVTIMNEAVGSISHIFNENLLALGHLDIVSVCSVNLVASDME